MIYLHVVGAFSFAPIYFILPDRWIDWLKGFAGMETYQNTNLNELNLGNSRSRNHIFESGTVVSISSRGATEGNLSRWIYQIISWVLLDGGDLVRRVAPGERALERWEYENLEARSAARGVGRIF